MKKLILGLFPFLKGKKTAFSQIALFFRIMGVSGLVKWVSLSGIYRYSFFQKKFYEHLASKSKITPASFEDHVVGYYSEHNQAGGYKRQLFGGMENLGGKIALDFGSGLGRNIILFSKLFKRIDGVDISRRNIDLARKNLKLAGVTKACRLFENNGVDLQGIESDYYDVVFSTISMQHIPVYDIRFSLLREMHRVLKPGGAISVQMGFGKGHPRSVSYSHNAYSAFSSNSGLDVRVDRPEQVKADLKKIGFRDFKFEILPTPKDMHENWIFFRAKK